MSLIFFLFRGQTDKRFTTDDVYKANHPKTIEILERLHPFDTKQLGWTKHKMCVRTELDA
jgi:hypothetical protein